MTAIDLEQQVLQLRAQGLSYGKIARKLQKSKATIHAIVKRSKTTSARPNETPKQPEQTPVSKTHEPAPKQAQTGFAGLPEDGDEAFVDHWDGVDLSEEKNAPNEEAAIEPPPEPHDWRAPLDPELTLWEKYQAPLPPPEAFTGGEVHLLAGFGSRKVENCPDFDDVCELAGDFLEGILLKDIPIEQPNGLRFTIDVKLPKEQKRNLGKAWGIPLYRLSRAIGVSGPIAELAEAAYKTYRVQQNIIAAIASDQSLITNMREGWPAQEPDDG